MRVITPTVGRQVWFRNAFARRGDQPEAATVCAVHHDRLVSLQVIGHDGRTRPELSVQLRQPDDAVIEGQTYCEWMPYQIGQAARTEQPEPVPVHKEN